MRRLGAVLAALVAAWRPEPLAAAAAATDDCFDDYSTCQDYIDGSDGHACEEYFCETCSHAGHCDLTCNLCGPSPAPTLTRAPTPAPSDDCFDDYDTCQDYIDGSGGHACEEYFCETCSHAGHCDLTCGLCGPSLAPSASISPSVSVAPSSSVPPTPAPSQRERGPVTAAPVPAPVPAPTPSPTATPGNPTAALVPAPVPRATRRREAARHLCVAPSSGARESRKS